MDVQVVLVIILTLLTINLVAVGIYVILVLKEFRQTIVRLNSVLDNIQEVTDAVVTPMNSISSVISGISSGLSVFSALKGFKKSRKEDR